MRYLKKIARLIKLNAAAPDLESQVYENADDFKSALHLWADHFNRDLLRLVERFDTESQHAPFLAKVQTFGNRVDAILARRCLQYTAMAKRHLQPLPASKRKEVKKEALAYLDVLDMSLALVAGIARRLLTEAQSHDLVRLEKALLERVASLDVPSLIELP